MIKAHFSSPIALGISGTAAFTAWTAMGYPTDPKHLMAVLTTAAAGVVSPNVSPTKPNVASDSHIQTPYANNLEETK